MALAWSKRENAELRVRLAQNDLADAERAWNQLKARALADRPGAELVSIRHDDGILETDGPAPAPEEEKTDQ